MAGQPPYVRRRVALSALVLAVLVPAAQICAARAQDANPLAKRTKLLPHCALCTTHVHCASRRCEHNRCVFDTPTSFARCFSHPVLNECDRCSSPGQCKQGVCWGHKCTDGTMQSRERCFRKPCEACTSSLQCSTKLCFAGRCASPGPADGGPPRPCVGENVSPGSGDDDTSSGDGEADTEIVQETKKANCDICESDDGCESGLCNEGLCVDTNATRELFLCRRAECGECSAHEQCRSGFCLAGKCVFRKDATSRGRCFPEHTFRPRCAACTQSLDCAVGVCDEGKCTDGGADAAKACLVATCGECAENAECRGARCWRGRCIAAWRTRLDCFDGAAEDGTVRDRAECASCVRDRHCDAGACVRGRCVTVPEQAGQRCFRPECDECKADEHCQYGAKCVDGRCTSEGEEGRALCDES